MLYKLYFIYIYPGFMLGLLIYSLPTSLGQDPVAGTRLTWQIAITRQNPRGAASGMQKSPLVLI